MPSETRRVSAFLPWYSSVHRGAGWKSQLATGEYEDARAAALAFAGRTDDDNDVAIICRNTTEAINHFAYRLRLESRDVVVTTVVEHHANLLPWARLATLRYVECGHEGTFAIDDVIAAVDLEPRPKLLAMTGASNVSGWMAPLDPIIEAAHQRGVPVLVDAAQLAPHRPLPRNADFLAWSGHKMYAPFGAGVLIGPRQTFATGDPLLAGGGAVDLVDLNEVIWTDPPEREEAGSPKLLGAVALHAAIAEFGRIGWDEIVAHEQIIALRLREGLSSIDGVRVLGVVPADSLPVVAFVVDRMPNGLVSARLSAEHGIGVRHGSFCAHPYLLRSLGLRPAEVAEYRAAVVRGDRRHIPAPSAPVPAYPLPRKKSTDSSTRCGASPSAIRRRCRTKRIHTLETTGRKRATLPGRAQADTLARPAPGDSETYHMVGKTEHQSHEEVLAEFVDVAGKRVVDVGCGSGGLVRWLRGQHADVVGVECGEVMLRVARESDPDHPESYLEGVGQDLPLPDAEFDVVVYSYSFHHVPAEHMVDALREANRVLRPEGTLYVVEPIAAGPGHEVIKLVDDETEVRSLAQRALEHAEGVGLELVTEHRYNSRMILSGADALAERVVGVDPRRARRMEEQRAQFVERFNTLATPVEGGYALDQENRIKIFRRH